MRLMVLYSTPKQKKEIKSQLGWWDHYDTYGPNIYWDEESYPASGQEYFILYGHAINESMIPDLEEISDEVRKEDWVIPDILGALCVSPGPIEAQNQGLPEVKVSEENHPALKLIPQGEYCYKILSVDAKGRMTTEKCPYWHVSKDDIVICAFTGEMEVWDSEESYTKALARYNGDIELLAKMTEGSIALWDQVKCCGINIDDERNTCDCKTCTDPNCHCL